MKRLEYEIRHAGLTLARAGEALLGKPDYLQRSVDELPILEAAARETGHRLKVAVARYADGITENNVRVVMDRKVMDPWGNRFWGKVIELRAAAKPSESLIPNH